VPQLKLVGFDLDYIWRDASVDPSGERTPLATLSDAAMNPFSRQLALPYMTAINNVVERFVTFQVVKYAVILSHSVPCRLIALNRRYPLIFGTWCKV